MQSEIFYLQFENIALKSLFKLNALYVEIYRGNKTKCNAKK